jgi:hypothetical protein
MKWKCSFQFQFREVVQHNQYSHKPDLFEILAYCQLEDREVPLNGQRIPGRPFEICQTNTQKLGSLSERLEKDFRRAVSLALLKISCRRKVSGRQWENFDTSSVEVGEVVVQACFVGVYHMKPLALILLSGIL